MGIIREYFNHVWWGRIKSGKVVHPNRVERIMRAETMATNTNLSAIFTTLAPSKGSDFPKPTSAPCADLSTDCGGKLDEEDGKRILSLLYLYLYPLSYICFSFNISSFFPIIILHHIVLLLRSWLQTLLDLWAHRKMKLS